MQNYYQTTNYQQQLYSTARAIAATINGMTTDTKTKDIWPLRIPSKTLTPLGPEMEISKLSKRTKIENTNNYELGPHQEAPRTKLVCNHLNTITKLWSKYI